MGGRGKIKRFFDSVCVIEYVPHTLRIRYVYVPHTVTHTLTHTLKQVKALQALCFGGVAMFISPLEKARSECV
jgi:hypothetical protein